MMQHVYVSGLIGLIIGFVIPAILRKHWRLKYRAAAKEASNYPYTAILVYALKEAFDSPPIDPMIVRAIIETLPKDPEPISTGSIRGRRWRAFWDETRRFYWESELAASLMSTVIKRAK